MGALVDGQSRLATGHGYAAPGSPPPPPTYVPTPIGGPPSHPTDTAVVTTTGTPATAVPVTATATPSPTSGSSFAFSLDAARVAPVNDPGDFSGLATVTPKSSVWLMMYLTIKTAAPAKSADSVYEIRAGSRSLLRASYVWKTKARETGRFSRYMGYKIPASVSLGQHLTLTTTLKIGNKSQSRTWNFVIGKQARIVRTTRA